MQFLTPPSSSVSSRVRLPLVSGKLVLILGLAVPVLLWPVHKVWMSLAYVLGWVMTRVILSLLFFLGITPVGLLGRLFGKKFLDVDMQDSRQTYWIRRDQGDQDPARYEKQY